MGSLSLSLFGPLSIAINGEPVTDRLWGKTRALLVYLLVESHTAGNVLQCTFRRETLAGLLWPEQPEEAAHTDLRQALHQLRQVVLANSSCLEINSKTVQYKPAGECWSDAGEFVKLINICAAHRHLARRSCPDCLERLQQAAGLYRGDFLAGLTVKGSIAFEEWVLLKREQFRQSAILALHDLAEYFNEIQEYGQMEQMARQLVEIDPFQEKAHRQLMRALSWRGQRNAALLQYESLGRLLKTELGVEPEPASTVLRDQILTGQFDQLSRLESSSPPSWMGSRPEPVAQSVFVSRQAELAKLQAFYEAAASGHGGVVFVAGEAGWGKTSLLEEFGRRLQLTHPDVVFASGHGNAFTGLGDPYLPFREVLEQLSGDVEAPYAAGILSQTQAVRLWRLIPLAAQALVHSGPDLIGTFLRGSVLLKRAEQSSRAAAFTETETAGSLDWFTPLQDLIERKAVEQTGVIVPQQSDLFKQYTQVLKTLARQRPLVLLLDDFQWADAGSISLLFHLGREIAGCRIILLVAYRPTDLMLGYNHTGMPAAERENHPLESVINEFKRSLGDIEIVLDQQDGQNFSGELLDTEPNQLGADFREMFYQQTREYPLFTVELLRSMQERGDLIRDPYGRWIEGAALDWSILPKRVEAVIAERLRRLPQNLRAILETASIEGEVFTAGVIAAVQHMDEREIIQALSGELSKLHRLVRAERSAQPVGLQKPAGLILSQYRFGHILFQRYLVQNLDPVERAHLHAEVAAVIELLYAGSLEEVALQLAWHFQEAGLPGKAISYLQQAGERAVHLSAHQEAIVHFSRALELLPSLPDEPGRLQLELALQIGLASSTCAIKGYGDARVGQAFDRARSLCQQIGETAQLFPVQWLLARFYAARADFKTAFEIMSQLTDQAERLGDPTLLVIGHWGLGWYHFFEGNFNASWTNLRAVLDFYDPQQHHSLAFTFGEDPGVICCSLASVVLWELGYPDQARQLGQEAIRLAEQLSDPYSLAAALGQVSLLDAFRRDFVSSNMLAEQCVRISTQHGYLYWAAAGMVAQSLAQIETGQVEKGIENCHRGSASYQATGAEIGCRHQLAWLANAYGKVGRVDEGLALLAETLTEAERSGEGYYNAEIQRLMGDLLLKKAGTHQAEAEQRYWQAIETARRHSARSWELRAVLSLCRLWLSQGDPDKISRGQQLLLELYSWFTEGFDSPDLQDARQLLEQLA